MSFSFLYLYCAHEIQHHNKSRSHIVLAIRQKIIRFIWDILHPSLHLPLLSAYWLSLIPYIKQIFQAKHLLWSWWYENCHLCLFFRPNIRNFSDVKYNSYQKDGKKLQILIANAHTFRSYTDFVFLAIFHRHKKW